VRSCSPTSSVSLPLSPGTTRSASPRCQKHIAVLERATLVTKERRGREQIVHANGRTIAKARRSPRPDEALWESTEPSELRASQQPMKENSRDRDQHHQGPREPHLTLVAEFDAKPEQVLDGGEDPHKLERWWGPAFVAGHLHPPRLRRRRRVPLSHDRGPTVRPTVATGRCKRSTSRTGSTCERLADPTASRRRDTAMSGYVTSRRSRHARSDRGLALRRSRADGDNARMGMARG